MLTESEKIEHLRGIKLMAGLAPHELKMIARIVPDATYHRGEVIYYMGDPADYLFLLMQGRAKIVKYMPEGKEKIRDIVEPGNILGEHFLTEVNYQEEAVALEDALICKIVRSKFIELLRKKPKLALNFIHLLSARIATLQSEVEELSFYSTRQRLARLLLTLAEQHDVHLGRRLNPARVQLAVGLSHEDLAHMLGSNRPHVSEIMSEFHKEGLINYEKHQLIVNCEKLEAYVKSIRHR